MPPVLLGISTLPPAGWQKDAFQDVIENQTFGVGVTKLN